MTGSPRDPGASAPKPERKQIRLSSNLAETVLPGAPPVRLPLASIVVDPAIQQRTQMDQALIDEYAETIAGWIDQAPVVVYGADGLHHLADGFHRVGACARAGLESIPVILRPGTRRDALIHALGANASHGRRRSREDLDRAYQTAVAEGFATADDTAAVAKLLHCSDRWASELTREARDAAKAERDAEIQRLAEEGKSQREIAEQVGISVGAVNAAVQKRNTSETEQAADPTPTPALPAFYVDAVTEERMAEAVGMTPENMRLARIVVDNGTPELIAAMDAGTVSIAEAAVLAKQAPDEQHVGLTPSQKGAQTRTLNNAWSRKQFEISRQLRISEEKYGREKVIAFLRGRLAAMEGQA